MIFTECCYCDEPMTVSYEAGDRAAGGFVRVLCEECKEPNYVELVSVGGTTYSEEEFKRKFIDTGLVRKEE